MSTVIPDTFSPYSYPRAIMRWITASFLGALSVLIFLLIIVKSEKKVVPPSTPYIQLTQIDLPPAPKAAPRSIPKPKPLQEKKTNTPTEAPKHVAPKIPLETTRASQANTPPRPITSPAHPQQKPPGASSVRIDDTKVLDNVGFDPVFFRKPRYPDIARKANIQGFVDIDLLIDPLGKVENFTILTVTGHPAFGNETAKVVGSWRFPPPRIDGKKVSVRYVYRVNFTLN